jgi:hypothetical protein
VVIEIAEGAVERLLVDEDGTLVWRKPGPLFGGIPIEHDILGSNVPRLHALPFRGASNRVEQNEDFRWPLVQALSRVGVFTPEGLKVVTRIWQPLKLDDQMHYSEIEARNRRTLEALEELGYQLEASKEEVRRVMDWQWPMYSLDFTDIKVTEDAIQRERDAAYADYV